MNYKFKNLVFEGGGVKGVAYGGALVRLEEMNVLQGIERVAGTSAGAITACLLCVGYNSTTVSKIISETSFKKFEDNTFFFIRDIFRLIKNFGWNRGDVFEQWIGDLIYQKTGNKEITFRELHQRVLDKEEGFRDLFVIATNVTKQRAEILSHETYPDMPIYKAVRMSMSIPIFFEAVKNDNGDFFVDGGLTSNYAIQIFDKVKYVNNQENCFYAYSGYDEEYAFNYETLGFRVDSLKEKNYLNPTWIGDPSATKNLKRFVLALVNFTIEMVNKKHLNSNDWCRTVFIDSGDVNTTEFNLKPTKIQFLIASGMRAVDDYFFWKNNDSKWSNYPK